MASCQIAEESLPILTGCPGPNELIVVGNAVGGVDINGQLTVGFARRYWKDLMSCIMSGLKFMFKDFVVGQPGDILGIGGTSITLTFSSLGINGIFQDSVFLTLIGSELPRSDNTQVSYTIVYSSTNVVITLNQGGQSGQQYILHYSYF